MTDTPQATGFASLGLPFPILRVLEELGYEQPSPIQAESIPNLLEGKDVLGLAQTGTGKTAAFSLPLLSRTNPESRRPQVLVLAPTRELAQQVAQACESYAKYMNGIKVAAVYGGQDYGKQIRALKGGAQWVVGTPGRIMDHLEKGTLKLEDIQGVVLDEADEMLRMGFIDDVDFILGHTPSSRQVALFSATMPKQIKNIANKHLNNPVEVCIKTKATTASTISQSYWVVRGAHKDDALLRFTEAGDSDATMVFVRTKQATEEVAEYMQRNGVRCQALNGDIPQQQRERVVEKLKKGELDVIVATDVAARGLDVERISHVVNYDIPYDTESYVHRIGRTGRAGRTGAAITFVRPREMRMLRSIEKTNRTQIEEIELPSAKDINAKRREKFKERVVAELAAPEKLATYKELITELVAEKELDVADVAASIMQLMQGNKPLFLNENERPVRERREREDRGDRDGRRERGERKDRPRKRAAGDYKIETDALPLKDDPDVEMVRYCLSVGYDDGVKPGNIVGAIANEADIESRYIGHIEIFDDFSTIDLPDGMPQEVLKGLKNTRICGSKANIVAAKDFKEPDRSGRAERRGGNDRGRGGNDRGRGGNGGQRRDGGRGKPRNARKGNNEGRGNDNRSGGSNGEKRPRKRPAE